MSNSIQTDHNCKKRKRGEARIYRFRKFGENGHPVDFDGSFRQNLRALLELGHFESSGLMSSWSFQLEVHRHPPLHVLLFVVEDPVEASLEIHCRLCQYVAYAGWGHHMVCNKKYHFLIPSKETMAAYLKLESHCDSAEPEKERYSQFVGLQGHVLHGVFHSNGFGHLLCLNGIESGSDMTGQQVMEFWDRLCTGLRARKVSLSDTSRKRGMDLRLLHGVAHGESWFGRWGYRFGSGTYGVTLQIYQNALEAIQNIPLCLLSHHVTNFNHEIPILFSKYQTLSDGPLITLCDLFHYMFELKSRLPKENHMDPQNSRMLIDSTNSRWSQKRIEMAIKVIIDSLKRVGCRWISRQDVRDAARIYVGDTGLLDFVLKSLGNQIVGNYLVRRSLNPVTKVLEYCLEDISNLFPSHEQIAFHNPTAKVGYNKVTRAQVMKDVLYLYKYILRDNKGVLTNGMFNSIPMASRVILDAKYFIKEYCAEIPAKVVDLGMEGRLKVLCTIVLKTHDKKDETTSLMPPYECITLRNNATFNDLRIEAERVFREIYWGLKDITAESITNVNAIGTDLVFEAVEGGRKIVFEGRRSREGGWEDTNMVCENGLNCKAVECGGCGAKEDDGERMVCCDICEVWQHTRCVRIPNNEEIPHIFLCKRCEQEIVLLSSLP